MSEDDLDSLMAAKRDQLIKIRDEAQATLNDVTAKLRGIEGYYAAMSPKSAPVPTGEPKTRKPREKGKRAEVLKLVASYPDGVTVGELKDKLSIRGDKSGEQSLSNALSALKKAGQLTLIDGRYAAASPA